MDMVRSMMSWLNLLELLWGEVIKTAIHILNHVPSKLVPKTPFDLWTRRKPILNHFRVLDHSKGFRFYCPKRGTGNEEALIEKFLEVDVVESSCYQPLETPEPSNTNSIPLPPLFETVPITPIREEIVTLPVQ
ncbi:Retrovirus-related Pol polyprotein from transposon TNT 1-94 [Senna tora]|uniref:Retrovirus-related Pol polyprotein from transposon TNT 1-94 n=1 Tax=Senna tora TaxID=362788 RepID=A0A834XG12_9FABA|nr:Retrovirus-related Pol polyprotein from transposon TNT 1-94 [Senna tora]